MEQTEKVDLFRYLRDNELRHLYLRRAFMADRARLRTVVENNRDMDWRDLSVRCGYRPDTLVSVISDGMVVKQQRYNYKALIKALRAVGLTPQPELVEYERTVVNDGDE